MNSTPPVSNANQQAEQSTSDKNLSIYQLLVENSHDIIYILGADGVFTFVSPAWTTLLGHPVNEVIGQSFQPLVHPDDVPVCMAWLQKVVQTGQRQEGVEYRVRHINGEWRWHTSSATPLKDENDIITGFYGIARDISAQKQAEEQRLQSSELRFEGLVGTLADWVWEVDQNGNYTYVSPRIKDLLGYEPGEVIGKTPFDLMPAEEAQRVAGVFGPLLSTQQPLNAIENINQHKNGSRVMFETSGVPFYDAQGNFKGYRGSDRDITERKKADEERRRFELMVQNSTDFINMADLNGNIVFLNTAGQRMLGIAPEEIQSQVIFNLLEENSLKKAQEEVLPTIMKAGAWTGELQYVNRKTGKIIDAYASAYMLRNPETNAPQYLVNISRDISEQKQIESEVQESRRALSTLMNNLPGMAYRSLNQRDWPMEFVSQGSLALTGYPPEDLIKSKKLAYGDLIHPEDQDMVWEKIQEAFSKKEQFNIEYRITTASGKEKVVFERGSGIWSSDNELIALEGFIEDISEQKRLEQQIQEAFERRGYQVQISTEIAQEIAAATKLEELFENVVSLTKERLGYYHTQLLRYDPAQDSVLLIKGYGETGAKMLADGHKMAMGRGLIGTAAATGETVMRPTLADDPDWQPNPLLPETKGEIALPIKWQNNVLGVLDVQSDQAGALTEDDRLLLESLCGQIAIAIHSAELVTSVRESELRYQQILDAITDMILVKGEKSSIVWANKAFREYYGMSNEQLRDMIDAPLVEPDYTLQYIKDDAYVFESGEILQIPEEPVTRYDGVVRPFETFKAPIRDLSGKVIMTVGVSRDITERLRDKQIMAEQFEEVTRLYQAMSREGWKTYRETTNLPVGFIYDKAGIRPIKDEALENKAFAEIPMKVLGGEIIGTLSIENDLQNPIPPEDIVFLQQVSDQIALAMESARLTAQTQSALAQTERLSQASLQLTRANNLQELLEVTVKTIEIPVINRAFICSLAYTPESKVKDMTVIANWWNGKGQKATDVGTKYTKENLEAMSLFLSPTPLYSNDALNDERIEAASKMIAQAKNIRAIACLPLYTGETQIGFILLEGEEPHDFSEDETRLFTAMGPQIATVLENRRQFERAQRQAEREAMLNAISQKIQSATSVEAVLQIAARELGHALGAPRTIAQLSLKDK